MTNLKSKCCNAEVKIGRISLLQICTACGKPCTVNASAAEGRLPPQNMYDVAWEKFRDAIVTRIHNLVDSEFHRVYEESKGAFRRDGGRLMNEELSIKAIIEHIDHYVSTLSDSILREVLVKIGENIKHDVDDEVSKYHFMKLGQNEERQRCREIITKRLEK